MTAAAVIIGYATAVPLVVLAIRRVDRGPGRPGLLTRLMDEEDDWR